MICVSARSLSLMVSETVLTELMNETVVKHEEATHSEYSSRKTINRKLFNAI